MSKLVLKICCGDWNNASRDKRELSVCQELGMKTIVMAKGSEKDKYKKDKVSGYKVLRFSTRPIKFLPASVNRLISLFTWSYYAKRLKPDIISGHGIEGLLIGWMSNFFRKNKAKLIYDSHEFEIGRNAKRNIVQIRLITYLERFLIKRCAFSIMVNDAIADKVRKIHKLKERPVVVRSTPNLWKIDSTLCTEKRKELLSEIETPTDFVLMYHGGVMSDRGIETLIKILRENQNVCAIILGDGETRYLESLRRLSRELGVMDRVLFHCAVPIEELWKYVGAADVGLILAPAIVLNHLYSLPNKFFENIQSEVPIICPNYPAMKPIVDRYKIGLTCNPENISDINECIERMRTDKVYYEKCKENLKIAKTKLCWEKEKWKLVDAYESIV